MHRTEPYYFLLVFLLTTCIWQKTDAAEDATPQSFGCAQGIFQKLLNVPANQEFDTKKARALLVQHPELATNQWLYKNTYLSPLHIALTRKDPLLIHLLLEHKVDINLPLSLSPGDNNPSAVATLMAHPELLLHKKLQKICSLFLQHGIDFDRTRASQLASLVHSHYDKILNILIKRQELDMQDSFNIGMSSIVFRGFNKSSAIQDLHEQFTGLTKSLTEQEKGQREISDNWSIHAPTEINASCCFPERAIGTLVAGYATPNLQERAALVAQTALSTLSSPSETPKKEGFCIIT